MLVISERVLEYGANRGKDMPTAQGLSVYRVYRLNMSILLRGCSANVRLCVEKSEANQYAHSYSNYTRLRLDRQSEQVFTGLAKKPSTAVSDLTNMLIAAIVKKLRLSRVVGMIKVYGG